MARTQCGQEDGLLKVFVPAELALVLHVSEPPVQHVQDGHV